MHAERQAKLVIRFRLTYSVIRKITKLHFWATQWEGFVGEFFQENVSFTRKTTNSRF